MSITLIALAVIAVLAFAAVETTSTLSDLIQEEIQKPLPPVKAQTLFYPGGPAHSILRVRDLTASPGGSSDFNKRGELTAHDVVEGEEHNVIQNVGNTSVNVPATESQINTLITNKTLRELATSARDRMTTEVQDHKVAHGEKFDVAVFSLFSSLTEGAADTGDPITISDCEAAVAKMRELEAPGPWVGFLSETQWHDLATEASSALSDASQSGDIGEEYWRNYEIKRFLNVTWFISTNVQNDGTDDYGAILSPRAIGAVLKLYPMQYDTEYQQLRRGTLCTSVTDWGVGVVEDDMGVYIQTSAT
ncbi:MAG: hypothetical protein ACOCX2_11165 [Armatimonadota bacterium]